MKKLNAIIIDHDAESIEILRLLLRNKYEHVHVVATASTLEDTFDKLSSHEEDLDLAFFQISMPEADILSMRNVEEISFKVIFTAPHEKLALKKIRFSSLDFLLKPINMESYAPPRPELSMVAENAPASMSAAKIPGPEKLAITTLNEIRFIDIADITYLEGNNNYTNIYVHGSQKLTSSKHLGHYENILDSNYFCRIHNSYMVNMKKIIRYIKGKSGYVELEGGTRLEISTRRKDEFMQKLGL